MINVGSFLQGGLLGPQGGVRRSVPLAWVHRIAAALGGRQAQRWGLGKPPSQGSPQIRQGRQIPGTAKADWENRGPKGTDGGRG